MTGTSVVPLDSAGPRRNASMKRPKTQVAFQDTKIQNFTVGIDIPDAGDVQREKEDKDLDIALRFSVSKGDDQQIRELVLAGADVNAQNNSSIEPPKQFTKRKEEDGVEDGTSPDTAVSSHSNKSNSSNSDRSKKEEEEEEEEEQWWLWRLLGCASRKKELEKSKPMITGDYIIHTAAETGNADIVRQLFYFGAKLENVNRIGSTALHRAVSQDKHDAVLELLHLGANLHAQNRIGNTPLHVAVACGSVTMVQLLLANGAISDLRTRNKVFMTPIQYAPKNSPERDALLAVDPTLAELQDIDDWPEQQNLGSGAPEAVDNDVDEVAVASHKTR